MSNTTPRRKAVCRFLCAAQTKVVQPAITHQAENAHNRGKFTAATAGAATEISSAAVTSEILHRYGRFQGKVTLLYGGWIGLALPHAFN
jgi:hypothetical protein